MARVVITGIGIYSCIGIGVDEVDTSLRNGRSGIGLLPERAAMGYRSPLCALVPRPDATRWLDRKQRAHTSEQGLYAYISALEALGMAGVDDAMKERDEIGIIYGNDSSVGATVTAIDTMRAKHNTTLLGSGSVFRTLNSTVTLNLGPMLGLRGISLSVGGACTSGSHAIGLGYALIRSGMHNCILCGGAQEVNDFSVIGFDGLGVFSMRTDDPQSACRPFDADRDGLVPGGGAASLVLESLDSARARGARILAEVVGYGCSSAGSMAAPSTDGPQRAIAHALADAHLPADAIDYINAHATSTPAGDAAEAQVIAEMFGRRPWVSSTKSMTGHEMWMAGASEAVYSVLMMQGGYVAPNINFDRPDEASAQIRIASQTVETQVDTVLSNSFGFGGTNSALIIKKFTK